MPVDEWGRAFHYLSPGPNGEPFVVLSYGKDGRPGGSGEAADLIRPASDVE
jgi:general secretion pathway protein G